jgi:hypothetical protein
MVSGNMMRLFNRLLQIGGSLQELFYDPAGRSIKNGRFVGWTPGGHYDHVHAGTFDAGGILPPGLTLALNNTGRNEYVSNNPTGGSTIYWSGDIVVQGADDPEATAEAVLRKLQRRVDRGENLHLTRNDG